MNDYAIELEVGKELPHSQIYSLDLFELEKIKTYIETALKTGFIWLSKLLAVVPILFDQNQDRSLYLSVNYRGLNNLSIQNWYSLPLIDEILD